MASGRQVEYRLNLQSNATSVLTSDTNAANKFDNSMWQVQKTLAAFGVGLGAHFLIDAAKSWTQGAADFEQAMLRIRNSAKDGFGFIDEKFVNAQVDKFKLKLQETADAYGNFLFKIKNANLSNDVSNRLFENLGYVSKVGGIPQEQMDATIRNVGILLGEGVLEARHLRQLSYVHPQIVPFLAEALGIKGANQKEFEGLFKKDVSDESAQQIFSQLISSGKLTKLALPAQVILEAFEKYRLSLESKLPETLDLVNSHLNSLSVTWERFKNSLVLGQKPELVSLFKDLEGSIKWLTDHEESIVRIAKNVLEITKLWLEWKAAMLLLNGANSIYLAFMEGYNGLAVKNISAIEAQTLGYNGLAAAIERMNIANQQAVVYGAAGLGRFGIPLSSAGGVVAAESGVVAAGISKTITGGLMNVFIAGMALQVIDYLFPGRSTKEGETGIFHPLNNISNSFANARRIREMENNGYDVTNKFTGDEPEFVLRSKLAKEKEVFELASAAADKWRETSEEWHKYYGGIAGIGYKAENGLEINKFFKKMIAIPVFNEDGKVIAMYEQPSKEDSLIATEWSSGTNIFGDLGFNKDLFNKYLGGNKPKLNIHDDSKTRLRGNSSNFFTVHIHGDLNGIQKLEIKEASPDQIKNIENIVGEEITRNMLEVINDIQVVRNGH